jgi:hypothetical protein
MNLKTNAPRGASAIDDSAMAGVIRALTWTVLGVCLVVWGVVGFIFWIPLLLRATVIFSVTLVQATLQSQNADDAGVMLKDAVNFYRRGFVVAVDAVDGSPNRDADARDAVRSIEVGRLANELAWAGLIWYVLLLFTGIVDTTPMDLWRSVAAVPWLDRFTAGAGEFADWLWASVSRGG